MVPSWTCGEGSHAWLSSDAPATLAGATGARQVIASRHGSRADFRRGNRRRDHRRSGKGHAAEGTLNYYHMKSIDITGRWTSTFKKRFGIKPSWTAGSQN
jgi:hypothetical protein